jgi:hypothetical protein
MLKDGMTVTEAVALVAHFLDTLFARELADLEAAGIDADVLVQRRTDLTAQRTEILAGVWEQLERHEHP